MFRVCVFVAFCSFWANVAPEFVPICKKPFDFYRHPEDCTRWIRCNWGIPLEMPRCQTGLRFSERAQLCVRPGTEWDDCKTTRIVSVSQQFLQVYDKKLEATFTIYHGMNEMLAGANATCASIGHRLACVEDPTPIMELVSSLSRDYPEIDTKSRIGSAGYRVYRLGGRVINAKVAECFDGTSLTNLPWGRGSPSGATGSGLSIYKPSGTDHYELDDVNDEWVIHFICQYP